MEPTLTGIIFDYGEVISQPQNRAEVETMLKVLDLTSHAEEFRRVYHACRGDYDGGFLTGVTYWSVIAGHFGMFPTEDVLRQLVALDIASWTVLNQEMIEYIARLKQKGLQLALLSNMPPEIMAYLKANSPWLDYFDQTVFSCQVKWCKPEPAIYRYCLERMGLEAAQCLFIDDRPENIQAALNCGIRALRYETLTQLKATVAQYL